MGACASKSADDKTAPEAGDASAGGAKEAKPAAPVEEVKVGFLKTSF